MTRASIVSVIAIVGFVVATSLHAADEGKSEGPASKATGAGNGAALFERLDANHDGFIASDEVPEESRRLYERLLRRADRNNDGKLSREEFIAGFEAGSTGPVNRSEGASGGDNPPRALGGFGAGGLGGGPLMGIAIFRALDTNGDGKLDSKEIAAASDVLKKLAGTSGELTREDLLKTLPAEMAARGGGGAGTGAGLAATSSDAAYKRMLEQFDKNGDGKVQKDELPRPLQERFEELDTNKDGSLDQSEIREILPRLIRRMQQAQGEAVPEGAKKGKKSENN